MTSLRITIILFFCMISLVPDLLLADAPPESDRPHIATILEHQTVGKYTYLKLDEQGKEVWIATISRFFKVSVSIGDKVEYKGGVPMANFKSEKLDKTFESIIFVTRIKVLSKSPEDIPGHDAYVKEQNQVVEAVPPQKGEIVKANDGMTISDIFTNKEELRGKEVTLRAKIMKINKNILKKNWITLRDGTGTAPDDKIIFTSEMTTRINDILTIHGVVRTDVDLGGTYKYSVLIEDIGSAN
jgi:hypothetical protein